MAETTNNIYVTKLRDLDKKTFYIHGVYNPYRAGGIEYEGKFIYKTFKYFPILPEEVVLNADTRFQELQDSKKELRLQVWNKEAKRFEFHKVKESLDRNFYATYKKVFDVVIELEEPISVTKWNGEIQEGRNVVLSGVGAGKIKSMIDSCTDVEIPLVDGKDKAGNPAKVRPFDWEDTYKDSLKGKFVKVKVTGEGMDTKYIFSEGKEFDVKSIKEAKESEEVGKEFEGKKKKKLSDYNPNDEIDVNDIPF